MYRNMPVDLVLVRHGQSEGNLAQRLWRKQQLSTPTHEDREEAAARQGDVGSALSPQHSGSSPENARTVAENARTVAENAQTAAAARSSTIRKASPSPSRAASLSLAEEAACSEAFRERHNSLYRLTDRGRRQAAIAGAWIKANVGTIFDKYFTSEYVRALETAAMLDLPSARWTPQIYLRERDRGVLANKSYEERRRLHPEEVARKERDAFYWQPSGGESIANLCLRVDRVIQSLSETCSGLRVIVVCHGGVIKAFRALLEHLRPAEVQRDVVSSSKPHAPPTPEAFGPDCKGAAEGETTHSAAAAVASFAKVHNCQIIWYTRRDPLSGVVSSKLSWVRSVCPWNTALSSNCWTPIVRHVYSNQDLLKAVSIVPQLVNKPLSPVDLLPELPQLHLQFQILQQQLQDLNQQRHLVDEWLREKKAASEEEREATGGCRVDAGEGAFLPPSETQTSASRRQRQTLRLQRLHERDLLHRQTQVVQAHKQRLQLQIERCCLAERAERAARELEYQKQHPKQKLQKQTSPLLPSESSALVASERVFLQPSAETPEDHRQSRATTPADLLLRRGQDPLGCAEKVLEGGASENGGGFLPSKPGVANVAAVSLAVNSGSVSAPPSQAMILQEESGDDSEWSDLDAAPPVLLQTHALSGGAVAAAEEDEEGHTTGTDSPSADTSFREGAVASKGTVAALLPCCDEDEDEADEPEEEEDFAAAAGCSSLPEEGKESFRVLAANETEALRQEAEALFEKTAAEAAFQKEGSEATAAVSKARENFDQERRLPSLEKPRLLSAGTSEGSSLLGSSRKRDFFLQSSRSRGCHRRRVSCRPGNLQPSEVAQRFLRTQQNQRRSKQRLRHSVSEERPCCCASPRLEKPSAEGDAREEKENPSAERFRLKASLFGLDDLASASSAERLKQSRRELTRRKSLPAAVVSQQELVASGSPRSALCFATGSAGAVSRGPLKSDAFGPPRSSRGSSGSCGERSGSCERGRLTLRRLSKTSQTAPLVGRDKKARENAVPPSVSAKNPSLKLSVTGTGSDGARSLQDAQRATAPFAGESSPPKAALDIQKAASASLSDRGSREPRPSEEAQQPGVSSPLVLSARPGGAERRPSLSTHSVLLETATASPFALGMSGSCSVTLCRSASPSSPSRRHSPNLLSGQKCGVAETVSLGVSATSPRQISEGLSPYDCSSNVVSYPSLSGVFSSSGGDETAGASFLQQSTTQQRLAPSTAASHLSLLHQQAALCGALQQQLLLLQRGIGLALQTAPLLSTNCQGESQRLTCTPGVLTPPCQCEAPFFQGGSAAAEWERETGKASTALRGSGAVLVSPPPSLPEASSGAASLLPSPPKKWNYASSPTSEASSQHPHQHPHQHSHLHPNSLGKREAVVSPGTALGAGEASCASMSLPPKAHFFASTGSGGGGFVNKFWDTPWTQQLWLQPVVQQRPEGLPLPIPLQLLHQRGLHSQQQQQPHPVQGCTQLLPQTRATGTNSAAGIFNAAAASQPASSPAPIPRTLSFDSLLGPRPPVVERSFCSDAALPCALGSAVFSQTYFGGGQPQETTSGAGFFSQRGDAANLSASQTSAALGLLPTPSPTFSNGSSVSQVGGSCGVHRLAALERDRLASGPFESERTRASQASFPGMNFTPPLLALGGGELSPLNGSFGRPSQRPE